MIVEQFLRLPGPATPDGVRPLFTEVGAAPTPTNCVLPPGSIVRFGTTYYLQRGTLTVPAWSVISTLVAQDLSALTGIAKLTAGVFSAATADTDYSRPIGPPGVYRARALSFLSLAASDATVGEFFDDFVVLGNAAAIYNWTPGVAGSGSVSCLTAAVGGGQPTLSTGATGGSARDCNGSIGVVANVSTGKAYVAFRFKIGTAVDAAALLGAGFDNAADNKTIQVGFFGPLNAANFVLQYDGFNAGSSVDLGVAVDTNYHVAEVYVKGDGKCYGRIDGGAEFSATMASAPADYVKAYICCRNGATAANRTLIVDWYYSMFVRT